MLIPLFAGIALKSLAVLGVAWLATLLLRDRSAAARHLVWTAAWASLLALPLLTLALPALRISIARPLVPAAAFEVTASAQPGIPASLGHSPLPAKAPVAPAHWRPDWRASLLLLWGIGAATALAQMLAGWFTMSRIRHTARRLPDLHISALAAALGIYRKVDLLETQRGRMPMAFGVLHPAVFLPSDSAGWTEDRRRMVLLHELAHVRRGDVAKHLLARTALSLYWWNPLAWVAWRAFQQERERATDDLVLCTGARQSEYAGHLVEIARGMQAPPALGWAAPAMARTSQLESRLDAILAGEVNRNATGRASVVLATLLAAVLIVPLAALRAQQTSAPVIPADVDAAIRAATSQKNYSLLDEAAKAAEAAQKYDIARKLLDAALAIRATVSGPQSPEYGVGLVNLGDLEYRRDPHGEALSFYTKATALLTNRPEAAPAWIHLGVAILVKANGAEANQFLAQQALACFQKAQAADPEHAGPALMWMAVTQQKQKNFTDAESLYQQALAAQDPNSAAAATTLHVYAAFLQQQDRAGEAQLTRERESQIRKALTANATANRPAPSADVLRIGGSVHAPSVASKVEPQYTDEARAANYQGTSVLSLEIRPDGLPQNIRVLAPLGLGLDDKAIEAINQWRFKPGTKDGQPVTVMATIEVNFRLL
jgi:TonB family protein